MNKRTKTDGDKYIQAPWLFYYLIINQIADLITLQLSVTHAILYVVIAVQNSRAKKERNSHAHCSYAIFIFAPTLGLTVP